MRWVGGGGGDDVPCTCTHVSCYATDGVGGGGGDDDVLTAGDNAAESVASVSKTQLRRMNLLRSVSSDPIEHRSLLAAHYLNKCPGLESVLRALAMHRQKASSGLLSPRECFQKPLWKA